ncbi:hypothetical protein [Streptomyces sp. NPDC086787]|uniref:hypothetical protein n=1 Tax=Streptomyces sp. NPDC086787 TaxID=3365759 RepID=UPI00380C03D2
MVNEQQHTDARSPEEQLDEARRRFTRFAERACAELRPGSPAAGPLLDGLALLTEALGGALTRVADDAARVVEDWHSDLNWTVREGGAATGARAGTAPFAAGRPSTGAGADEDGALEAVRHAQAAAEAARDAANATVRARMAAHRAWEVKDAEVAAARAARDEADLARQEALAAGEAAGTAKEEARAALERARTAADEARVAKSARADAEAERQRAEDDAEEHRREQLQAQAEVEEARRRSAAALRQSTEAKRLARSAEAEAHAAEQAAAEQREACAAADERARRAVEAADQERLRREEADAQADRELHSLAEAQAAAARAARARDEARQIRFHGQLELAVADMWERYRDSDFAFGTEPAPADEDTAALWTRVHLALLRLSEADRLQEASVFAVLARQCGLEPGPGTPAESGAGGPNGRGGLDRPDGRGGIGEGREPAPDVIAVPALPGHGVEEVRLSTEVPGWAGLSDGERREVTELLESALAGETEDSARERLALLLVSPRENDLLLTVLLQIWQADRLLGLDPGLGRWQDARTRRWIPWERKDFRRKATRSLTLLASVYPEPVAGWGWAQPQDAEFAVNWLHSLDAVLAFHHQAPALAGSWWWNWRLSVAQQLAHTAGWAGRRAVTDPDELTALFTGPRGNDYFEQPDICDRVSPPVQWIASPPLLRADAERNAPCLRKGRVVRGVGRG